MKYVLQLCDAFLVALSSCDRADLIALIARLQMEAKRRSAALRNERMTSGVTRSGDRSVTNNEQQVARLTKELNQTRQLLKAKSVIIQKLRKDLKIVTCDKTTDNNKLKRITGQQNEPRSENNSGKKAVTKTKAVVGHSNTQKVNMGIKQISENSCVDPSIASDRDSPSPTLSGSSREQATTSASSISSRREASARNELPETSSTGVRRSASDSLSSSLGKRAEALRTTHAAKTIQKHWRGHKDTRAAVKSNPPGSSGGTAQIYLSAENVEAFEQKRAAKTIQKQWRNHKHHREAAQGSGTKENVGSVKQGNTSAEAKDVKAVTDDNEDNNSAEEERKSALDCVIDATLSHFTRLRLLDIKSIQLDVSHV
uniref:Rho-GAP domain-containing protein n=1 Tax=Ascaris lumbricoides TaxID=6252 RepID=A0A0M3HU75_ASCLU